MTASNKALTTALQSIRALTAKTIERWNREAPELCEDCRRRWHQERRVVYQANELAAAALDPSDNKARRAWERLKERGMVRDG